MFTLKCYDQLLLSEFNFLNRSCSPHLNLGSFLLGASGSVRTRVYSLPASHPSHSMQVGRFCTWRTIKVKKIVSNCPSFASIRPPEGAVRHLLHLQTCCTHYVTCFTVGKHLPARWFQIICQKAHIFLVFTEINSCSHAARNASFKLTLTKLASWLVSFASQRLLAH